MCYAIPGKVTAIKEKTVVVDYFGQTKRAVNEFYDIKVGDYVCAQGGFVIKKVSGAEAQETLAAWGEIFHQLQEVDLRLSRFDFNKTGLDKKTANILDKALEGITLKNDELIYLLKLNHPQSLKMLFKSANFLRQKFHQNACCVHGIIEISNYCACGCAYCGISCHNKQLVRYRMSQEDILASARKAVCDYGFQALVLQSGEDPNLDIAMLTDTIVKIKRELDVLVCISFGEVGLPGLERLYKAGARGILLRFESSNRQIYSKLHPNKELAQRIEHIRYAGQLGYIIMTGSLIGLPRQTEEDIINDIFLARRLKAEMYSFGPFLPHQHTPLAQHPKPELEDIMKVLSLVRIIDPENAKILITTALETLEPRARRSGLLCGANSVMLNVTPLKYRKLYNIYPNRAYVNDSINDQIASTISLLKSLGRAPTDLGVSNLR